MTDLNGTNKIQLKRVAINGGAATIAVKPVSQIDTNPFVTRI